MKIGYLLQLGEEIRRPPYNGPANHVRQVFKELTSRGHELSIIFRLENQLWRSNDLSDFQPVIVRRSDHGLLRIVERVVRRLQHDLRLPYIGLFESLRFGFACLQELPQCDLFYERFSWMHYGGMLAAKWAGIPWVVEYNGDPLADLEAKNAAPSGFQRKLSVFLTRWSMHQASTLVATGEGWRKNAIDTWKLPIKKVEVIENGTSLLTLLDKSSLSSFRPHQSSISPVRIVYLGGFYPWHGIDKLLHAVSGLMRRGINLYLELIGGGDGFEAAQLLSQQLNLTGFTHFYGMLTEDQFAPILANAEIGVSPYCGWKEYSGLKIFDYKAAGLVCVASGENGQPTTLQHAKTGWIVPPCDVEALESALFYLCQNPDIRCAIGQAARLEAEKVHGWDHTAGQLETIFEGVRTR